MAKAVLVMDMPKTCKDCSCKYPSYKDYALYDCAITGKTVPIDGGRYGEKPYWCPLRELPEKKELYLSINNQKGYCDGWNACLDKILK
nr:MAG TPA: protein of unknown function (DUF2093) [Caudoviricetes sp.]